jgi:hypothetical protein
MGVIVDRFGFGALCLAVAPLPCAAAALLWSAFNVRQAAAVQV